MLSRLLAGRIVGFSDGGLAKSYARKLHIKLTNRTLWIGHSYDDTEPQNVGNMQIYFPYC